MSSNGRSSSLERTGDAVNSSSAAAASAKRKQPEASTPESVARPVKRTKRYKTWDQWLEELKQFKTANGHCRVRTSQGSLYTWLNNQCNNALNPNSSRYLKDAAERERRKKELESVLGTDIQNWQMADTKTWDEWLEELRQFKAVNGHCRVPKSHNSLKIWLNNQCNRFLNPNSSNNLKDAPERERRKKELESVLGTDIQNWRKALGMADEKSWDEWLKELKEFKAANGHCRVPTSHKPLYKWLNNQRHVTFNPSSPRCLKDTPERERRKNELESVLGISNKQWRERLDELKDFKASNGHCLVNSSFEPLYSWLHDQERLTCPLWMINQAKREQRKKELESVLGTELNGWRALHVELKYLRALQDFKLNYGHCRVPLRKWRNQYSPYFGLSHWLRLQIDSVNENHPTAIQDPVKRAERRQKLQDLGVDLTLCDAEVDPGELRLSKGHIYI